MLFGRNWNRRKFLKTAGAATLCGLAAGYTVYSLGKRKFLRQGLPNTTADRVILLWLAGGIPHIDTFDPKPHTPFKRGSWESDLRSTFPSIDTMVDGIKFSQGLEHIAQVIDRGIVIRSWKPPALGHILHSRHQYHWHTGYAPPQTIPVPHMGASIARILGSLNPDVPSFVHIGQRLDIPGSAEVKAFLTSGFLGAEFGPMLIPSAASAVEAIAPPPEMTPARFENRYKFYKKLAQQTPVGEFGSDYQRESLIRSMENAYRLIKSDGAKAFDLRREPREAYEKYNVSPFGLGCLLARRLVEVGVRFVEVSSEFIPFGNWDTHERGYHRIKGLKSTVDLPISQLILDLEDRGLLERTLVIVASEFSRASTRMGGSGKILNATQYGLHHHYDGAGSILMFGGGVKQGVVYGQTSDKLPFPAEGDVLSTRDIHATIYHTLGIAPDASFEVEQRPIYVTEDGEGKPILELLDV